MQGATRPRPARTARCSLTTDERPETDTIFDAIKKQYKGKDVQQQIRACVLDHIDHHSTKWVVLGGDSGPGGKGLVPDRDTRHP